MARLLPLVYCVTFARLLPVLPQHQSRITLFVIRLLEPPPELSPSDTKALFSLRRVLFLENRRLNHLEYTSCQSFVPSNSSFRKRANIIKSVGP